MASVSDAVVDYQLYEHVFGVDAVEGQVLAVARHHVAVLSQSLLDSCLPVGAIVLDETFRPDVFRVIACRLHDMLAPLEWVEWLTVAEVLDGFFNRLHALLGPQSNLALAFQQVSIELLKHSFQVWHNALRVLSEVVVQFKDCLVNFADVGSR